MTGTAKTEEVEFEKTYKLETTIVPPTGSGRVRTGPIRCTKPGCQMALSPTKQQRFIRTDGRCSWAPPRWRKRTAEFAAGGAGDPPQPAQRQAGEYGRESEIVARAGRAGAVTIATNMAGQGTDIILGGNSDYMARLKLREVLLGRLVKPEDDHKPPQPWRSSNAAGFADAAAPSLPRSGMPYPCPHRRHRSSPRRAGVMVKAWGDRAYTVIELEERIATAAEKAPTRISSGVTRGDRPGEG